MRAFLSHNKADREFAETLATGLAALGSSVWFDEWELQPGDSITGGIQAGLGANDSFVLVWSAAAANSNWVEAELAAYLHRRIADRSLRIIPVMLDETKLPPLVADYKGIRADAERDGLRIAAELMGHEMPDDIDLAQVLQRRLNTLAQANTAPEDPFRVIVCPACGARDLHGSSASNERTTIFVISCGACNWSDWSE